MSTGGNINKLFKLSNQKNRNSISLAELQALIERHGTDALAGDFLREP